MKFKRKNIIIVLLSLFLLTSCGTNTNDSNIGQEEDSQSFKEKYNHRFFGTFDTVIDIIVHADSEEEANKYFEYAEERFKDLHKLYTAYSPHEGINNVYEINKKAGTEPVRVEEDLFNLIESSISAYHTYSDKTDISMGTLIQVWQKYQDINSLNSDENLQDEDRLPFEEELAQAKENIGIDHIILDKEEQTVYVDDPNVILDVGATAKGYAVELVAQELEDMGCEAAIISGGGNIRTIGSPQDGTRTKWGVGIWDPDSPESINGQTNIIETVYIEQGSVVTSGDYQRFFMVDGNRYHHIIDKDTMYPARNFRSVSVVHEDSGLADFLSTACFILDYEEGKDLIESIDGAECMWVFEDLTIEYSPGFEDIAKSFGADNGS